MFFENFENLCKEIGKSKTKVADECGICRSTVSRWNTSGYVPRQEILAKLADYFGVTVDYLMNGDKQKNEPAGNSDKFVNDYYLLDYEDRETVDFLVFSLLQKKKYKKKNQKKFV